MTDTAACQIIFYHCYAHPLTPPLQCCAGRLGSQMPEHTTNIVEGGAGKGTCCHYEFNFPLLSQR
jgi:hypothetical protein